MNASKKNVKGSKLNKKEHQEAINAGVMIMNKRMSLQMPKGSSSSFFLGNPFHSYPHPPYTLFFFSLFAGSFSETADPMDVDEPPAEQFSGAVSAARIEAFERVFGQHMRTNRLDDISIADIETVVNNNGVGASRYSADEIMALLEVHHHKK